MRYSFNHFFITIIAIVSATFMGFQDLSAEEKTITFATEEWKDATNRDGTGLYWDILRAVFDSEGYQVTPLIRSYSGSVTLVRNGTVDGMIGAYIDEIKEGLYPEHHFAVDIVQALYKKKSKIKWDGIETIKGKRLAWIEGYSFNQYLPRSVMYTTSLRRVDSRKIGVNLLLLSKRDFVLDAEGDIKDFFKENQAYQIKDFVMQPICELKLYIVFSKTEKGKRLTQVFDQNFSKLLKAGVIKKMYKKYSGKNFTLPSDF
ncbi:MAG: transporter substrate-binding domain-containing protein [Desulfobacter sp.]|nr:transporter substrate-binding domain-containing protein [Desulfobacter sp.]WDP84403.1 MAG: transporter substrate-binding domain-containing protein [Desulfobacter sp.]